MRGSHAASHARPGRTPHQRTLTRLDGLLATERVCRLYTMLLGRTVRPDDLPLSTAELDAAAIRATQLLLSGAAAEGGAS